MADGPPDYTLIIPAYNEAAASPAGVPLAACPPVFDRRDAHWRASRQWHASGQAASGRVVDQRLDVTLSVRRMTRRDRRPRFSELGQSFEYHWYEHHGLGRFELKRKLIRHA